MQAPPDPKESPQTALTVGGPKTKQGSRTNGASKCQRLLAVKAGLLGKITPIRLPFAFKGWPHWIGHRWLNSEGISRGI